MPTSRTAWIVLVSIGLIGSTPRATSAQENATASNKDAATAAQSSPDLNERVGELEKEIEHLQTELTAVKKQLNAAPAAAAPAAPAATSAAAAPAASAAPASPPTPALTAAVPTSAPAAPAEPTLAGLLGPMSVTGFVDGYYGYNFEHPHDAACPAGTVPSGFATSCSSFRAFDGPSQQLALNMIELIIDKPPEANNSRLGYHLAFGFGNAMNVVNATDPGGLAFAQYIKEGYLSYLAPVGKGLQFDFGKFVTPNGAEVIETKDNWNYSRGLLFTYAIPFYHFGLRTKYTFNDKYSLTGYVVNGWNNIIDNNTGKTYGLSLGWNPNKKISVAQNYMVGPEENNDNRDKRQLIDTVVTYSPTSRLSLMWNYDYARGDRMPNVVNPVFWTGMAGYVRYAFNDRYALATRYEYFDDHSGFTTGTAQHLNEFTGTFERKINAALITRIEFRRDMSNRDSFLRGTAPARAENTALAGVVYTFDLKELK